MDRRGFFSRLGVGGLALLGLSKATEVKAKPEPLGEVRLQAKKVACLIKVPNELLYRPVCFSFKDGLLVDNHNR